MCDWSTGRLEAAACRPRREALLLTSRGRGTGFYNKSQGGTGTHKTNRHSTQGPGCRHCTHLGGSPRAGGHPVHRSVTYCTPAPSRRMHGTPPPGVITTTSPEGKAALVKDTCPEQTTKRKKRYHHVQATHVGDGAGSGKDALNLRAGGCFSVTSCPVSALQLGVRGCGCG